MGTKDSTADIVVQISKALAASTSTSWFTSVISTSVVLVLKYFDIHMNCVLMRGNTPSWECFPAKKMTVERNSWQRRPLNNTSKYIHRISLVAMFAAKILILKDIYNNTSMYMIRTLLPAVDVSAKTLQNARNTNGSVVNARPRRRNSVRHKQLNCMLIFLWHYHVLST